MTNLYDVKTEHGTILVEADDIAEARKIAKRYKAGPRDVARHVQYRMCDMCGCKPCCCGGGK